MKPEPELNNRIAALPPDKRAALMKRLQESGGASGSHRIPRRDPLLPPPLSFAQERLWFLAALEPESPAYNSAKAYNLNGPLNVEALQKTLDEIVRRHEALRTTFASQEGSPIQVIALPSPLNLAIVDLTNAPREQRLQNAMTWVEAETKLPFDLSTGPLIRATLLRLDDQENVLLIVLHHVVYDGWSADVLNRELSAFYGAFSQGQAPNWPELSIQYADYAIWQRLRLAGKELESRLAFWRKHLAGVEALDLLTDRPRPSHQTYRGARHLFTLSADLAAKLEKFNRQERTTPFMSLLAAFAVLLFRRSGQEDIVVGTPIANRPNVELEELIGFFVNSLVMRLDLSGMPSFRTLVARVRRAALDSYQHQDLPFEKLVEDLNPERHLSRHPLFQVMFAFQNAPRGELTLSGLQVSRKLLHSSSTRFDLELHLFAEGDAWSGQLVYSRDLFEEATIEGIARQYLILLEGMLAQPDRLVSLVPMMSSIERDRILVAWNATSVDYPRDRCVHELFEDQARRSPEAIAVEFGEQKLSYAELDERARELARYLRSLGVRRGAKVAICIESSTDMVVGLLAILKAGAAYVPIDPNYPEERISFMLADAQAAVVLTREGLVARLAPTGIKTVCLDVDREPIAASASEGGREFASPEDVAYVIFTSGSTGKPKGVCVPHRAVIRLVVNCDYVQLAADDVIAQISNCCFDAVTFEIWGALLNGSRLVGIKLERFLSAESFAEELAQHHVTTLFVTTALFNELVHERPEIFRNVRNVLFGGEECDPAVVERALECGPPERLVHVYGPTETTTFASWYQIAPNRSHAGRIPIGRPIANTQIYILDPHLNPTPIGVVGELWIGGDGVASGYLNRPELTAERFAPSPFVSGQRLYRTGDLGRFLPDGDIEFIGRQDYQVKMRGFRIEPGEIEAVLREHLSVAGATVVVREDIARSKQLVAYVVSREPEAPPKGAELREFLRSKLPDYMVPAAFVVLEKLPLTPNGKIDRTALPRPVLKEESGGFVEPRNETERIVADVWAIVLDLEGIGVFDDFFELGGHSLLATRVVSRLLNVTGIDIPLRVLFENANVAAMAEYIDAVRSTCAEGPSVAPVGAREEIIV